MRRSFTNVLAPLVAAGMLGAGVVGAVVLPTAPASAAPLCLTNTACNIFANVTPPIPDSGPDSAVELGVKFTADTNGFITGVRFYKGVGNVGPHTGTLWTVGGVPLATGTFSGETATGWQYLNFAAAVPITAGTTYIASYHTTVGHYSDTMNGFLSAVDNPPLHALASGLSGGNGVFVYGAGNVFPTNTFNASNYFVDVQFETACTTDCYVDAALGNDSNSGNPDSPLKTVQAGVNAVNPSGTVHVAAGTYTEQVVVNKPVTITGAGQATTIIQGPPTMVDTACIASGSRAVVAVCGSSGSTVVMSGVTISGDATGEDAGGATCADQIFGAYVASNETLNISSSTVTNVYNNAGSSLWGCQQGIGIRAGSSALGQVGHLIANGVTVQNYQKGGIVVDGVGSSTTIANSTIVGNPMFYPFIAMNGIEVARGASGSLASNAVSGNECNHPVCGADPINDTQSAGILVFDDPATSPVPVVSVTNNNVTGNDIGIYSDQLTGTATISGNQVNANRYEGIFLDEGSANVTGNTIANNGTANPTFGVGLIAVQGDQNSQGDVNATITGNTFSGNPTGVEATDVCPGAGCGTTDAFTVHLNVNRNAITGNTVLGVNNVTAPTSTVDATCNWWGAANGPGSVGSGSGDHVSSGAPFVGWLVTSNLNGPCPGPGAPTITAIYDGPAPYSGNSLEVAFTLAPSNGAPVTSETVTCLGIDEGPTGPPAGPAGIATGSGSPIFVGGPAVGAYQCTVTATNAFGTSVPSAPFIVFLGGTGNCQAIPTTPTALSTGPGNSSATVSWAPSTGCVAGYVVTPYVGGVAQLSVLIPGTGTTTVMKGLTNGVAYTFTVAAENGRASSSNSAMSGTITAGAPAMVTSLHVTRAAKGALRVAFGTPAGNGSPITRYTATCNSSNGGKANGKAGTTGPLTVTGLSPGKTYRCTVNAANKRGTGPTSHTSAAVKA